MRTKRMASLSAFVMCAALLALADLSVAQNALTNPNFDSDVSGWTSDGAEATITHSTNDYQGSGTSGSAEITNASASGGNGLGMFQCLTGVVVGNSYDFGGRVFIPSGQLTTGPSYVKLAWLDGVCGSGN